MKLLSIRTCLAAAAVGAVALRAVVAAELLHTEPSTFSPVVVYEEKGQRCMKFESLRAVGRQSCIDLDAPQKMVFDYTRTMMSALFVQPDPRRVLVIGLGGGTLPSALASLLPLAQVDIVEIDPAVVRMARRFFNFRESRRKRVFVEDGREFVERARHEGRQYDIIMLDAFDVDYIPRHLMTQEFLQHTRSILTPGGVLVANTFSASHVYYRESATYASVFGEFYNLRAGNRVIIAVNGPLPDEEQLRQHANLWAAKMKPFGIDVTRQLK